MSDLGILFSYYIYEMLYGTVSGENPPQKKIPLNAIEREPVPTRVLNPNASEASYKPK